MRSHHYIERDGVPVPVDMMTWARSGAPMHVAKTYRGDGKVFISTVFLGLDHNFYPDGPPLVYETMVFGMPDEGEICERYSTRAEALAGHAEVVASVDAMLFGDVLSEPA